MDSMLNYIPGEVLRADLSTLGGRKRKHKAGDVNLEKLEGEEQQVGGAAAAELKKGGDLGDVSEAEVS